MANPDRELPLFVQILLRPRIYDLLFALVTPATLFRIRRTCRKASAAVRDYFPRDFNANIHFSRFFTDALAFRNLQARTDTLVSGSNALQFLDRTYWPESDLDIYCYKDQAEEVGRWILEHGGMNYVYKPPEWKDQEETFEDAIGNMRWRDNVDVDFNWDDLEHPELDEYRDNLKSIGAVLSFESSTQTNESGDPLKVQVIVARQAPMNVVLGFHSTVVLNVLTWSHAYSFYPKATFEERRTLVLRTDTKKQDIAIEKYARRGWGVCPDIFTPDRMLRNSAFKLGERWADDSQSWILALDDSGIIPPPPLSLATNSHNFNPMALNNWKLVRNESTTRNGMQACLEYRILRPEMLRFRYTATEAFFAWVRDWFIVQGKQERLQRREIERHLWTWWDVDLLQWKAAYIEHGANVMDVDAIS